MWEKDDGGSEIGVVVGMQAGDGEVVSFMSTYECRGAVEEWLDGTMECCQTNLREQLGDSVSAYMETARDRWLHDYCAQLCITASQICESDSTSYCFVLATEGSHPPPLNASVLRHKVLCIPSPLLRQRGFSQTHPCCPIEAVLYYTHPVFLSPSHFTSQSVLYPQSLLASFGCSTLPLPCLARSPAPLHPPPPSSQGGLPK